MVTTAGMGLADAASGDVTTIMAKVLDDPYGVRDIEVKSVDVTADFSSTSRYAGISDATDRAGHPRRSQPGRRGVLQQRVDGAADHARHAGRPVGHRPDRHPDRHVGDDLERVLRRASTLRGGAASAPLTLAETKELIDGLPTNGDVVVAVHARLVRGGRGHLLRLRPDACGGDHRARGLGLQRRRGEGDGGGDGAEQGQGLRGRAHPPDGRRPPHHQGRAGGHLLPGGRQAGADGAHGHRDRRRRWTGWRCSPPCCRASGTTSWSRPRSARCPTTRCRAPTRSPSRSAPGPGWRSLIAADGS